MVRVAYQCRTDVTWGGETLALAGRTLEEAFALENLGWCQDKNRKPLQLRIAKADEKNLDTLAERIHKRVQAKLQQDGLRASLVSRRSEQLVGPNLYRRGPELA